MPIYNVQSQFSQEWKKVRWRFRDQSSGGAEIIKDLLF